MLKSLQVRAPDVGGSALRPIPPGTTVQFAGTKVFFRDSTGNRTPAPDGEYRLPNGQVLRVRNGERYSF